MRRTLAFVVAALAAVGAPGVPAARAADPAVGAADAALVPLQAEMMLLVELGAFAPPIPAGLQEVHDRWVSYAAGQSRSELLTWLDEVDAEGLAARSRLVSEVGTPSAQVATALGPLAARDRAALERSGRISVAPALYERAWVDLTERDGRGPGTAVTGRAAAAPDRSTTVAALALGGGALAIAAAGAVLLARRRRSARPAGDQLSASAVHDLLDAGQRLAGALDPAEVRRRAVEEAVAVTRADQGAFVAGRPGGRCIAHTTAAGFPADADLERGVVARALDAGQAGRADGGAGAVLAVPAVHAGVVVGALVVARTGGRAFSATDAETLGRLAPLVATALDAADRHTDAAALALVDPLTAVGNRRRLEQDLPGALGAPGAVGLAMVDVDHFKRFNDAFGHQAGDEALRLVAAALLANVRHGDTVYRYGGEEFCVLLPNARPGEALDVAERLRLAVAAATLLSWPTEPGRALTVSVGVALSAGTDGNHLVARADGALYAAKRAGRDRVVIAP